MKEKIKDILIRTFKTFIQGFMAALIYKLQDGDITEATVLKSAIIGALAAGVCAVMNAFIKTLEPKINTDETLDDELLAERDDE